MIERELPFAFITCGLRRLGSQGSGGSEDIHRVFSESVNALRETRLGEGKQGTLRCSAHREIEREIIAFLTHLAEIVGPEARFVHQGMTSSDILDTCLNVQLVRAADLLLADIDRVAAALKKRAFEHNIRSPSTTFGVKLAYAYAEFARARGRMEAALAEVATCALSGAVGTFANISPEVEAYVAKQMGEHKKPGA